MTTMRYDRLLMAAAVMMSACAHAPSSAGTSGRAAAALRYRSTQSFRAFFDTHATKHNHVTPLTSGRQLYQKRLEMIRHASMNIYIGQYAFDFDESQRPVLDALCAKSTASQPRNVDVKIMIDSFFARGNFGRPGDRYNQACDLKYLYYNPLYWWNLGDDVFHAYHSKITVVDGREAIVGGSGYSREYLDHGLGSKLWHDLDYYIVGEAAATIQDIFNAAYQWAAAREPDLRKQDAARYDGEFDVFDKRHGRTLIRRKNPIPVGNTRLLPIAGTPIRTDARPIFEAYRALIRGARHKIYLYAPFFAPLDDYADLLIQKARQGVDVRVITNSKESTDDHSSTTYASYYAMVKLHAGGVKVYAWDEASTFHRKGGMFDDEWMYFGSDNLDRRGQNYSEELVIFTDDAGLIEHFAALYNEDLSHSKRLDRDRIRGVLASTPWLSRVLALSLWDTY